MFPRLASCCLILCILETLLGSVSCKWVEGNINTKENWAFLARFCFLSLDGQFEYLIEYDKDMGIPNLLLYYDDDSQWPAVYHSSKTCREREAVLNKAGQNQMIKLSYWYPDTEFSGCIIRKANKEMPAEKSTTTTTTNAPSPTTKNPTAKRKNSTKIEHPLDPAYYDQFLKTTTPKTKTSIIDSNSTTWFEILPTDDLNSTAVLPEEDLWESVGTDRNDSQFENLKDVEILFDNDNGVNHKIKRSTFELYEHYHRRRLASNQASSNSQRNDNKNNNVEKIVVSCHNSRRFRSARERWWFIAISNCDSPKGLDVHYKFLMTNGPDGDFWHEHFSADEFYVLPVLLAYTFAYVIVMIAVVMCSVELKSRHLLHSTYKLFLISIVAQHIGVVLQSLAYIRYAVNGVGSDNAKVFGQFFCGVSETTFLLLLILMAKGYTITRGRLKVAFTVKLTIFMCCYIVTYIVLFVYQAKAFDPGEVLYLYESPAGYGLIVLRILAWCMFAYSTFFTVKKYPEKNMFYCPFFICGTLWFHAGALFILTANSYIDKWVRESVVTAVLLFITFSGHIMFLLLTLPVFANKNFPYHVRTTQIGVMEVTGNTALDSFGHNAYHPSNGTAQTVIIPLTRRTEELIGNMYNQYMASAPPLPLEHDTPKLNGVPKRIDSLSPKNRLVQQDSTDTNTSDDINPVLNENREIFTVENQMKKIDNVLPQEKAKSVLPHENVNLPSVLPIANGVPLVLPYENGVKLPNTEKESRNDMPSVLRSRRNILEPIKREEAPVPSWSLAKGPCVISMHKKAKPPDEEESPNSPNGSITLPNGKKVPPVRNGLPSSGEISTIHEGHVQSYKNTVSKATIDLFSVASNKE
ncbi:transmembrane protein 145-like [Galleria mellonella]|uniref:Transmembrane protein 145-like n=1 Tax=Galleria mellonella TaxID=7137 RepID=A0A6J1WRA3_GALME|nr:transmembrane protein 145-like [Galleria mellonella]